MPRALPRAAALARACVTASSTSTRARAVRSSRRIVLALTSVALTSARSVVALHAAYGSRVAFASAMGDADAYPGTAVERMANGRARAASLSEADLSGDWETSVRPKLLWAAGLRDMRDVAPGRGYTGHCFNDFNHVDATTMALDEADNENEGRVKGMAYRNPLGDGIRAASDPSLGPGGSWCTCIIGSASEPPKDVAHVQFRSKIAWKLVWVPGKTGREFNRFVLVDDAGAELATGVPTGQLPSLSEREANYNVVKGGRYAVAADARSV